MPKLLTQETARKRMFEEGYAEPAVTDIAKLVLVAQAETLECVAESMLHSRCVPHGDSCRKCKLLAQAARLRKEAGK